MTQRTSARTGRKIEQAQTIVEMLIKEPVKQAVREAIADEQIGHRPTGITEPERSSKGSTRVFRPKLLLSLLGVATAALYWRRRKSNGNGVMSEVEGGTGSITSTELDEDAEMEDESTGQDTEEAPTSS